MSTTENDFNGQSTSKHKGTSTPTIPSTASGSTTSATSTAEDNVVAQESIKPNDVYSKFDDNFKPKVKAKQSSSKVRKSSVLTPLRTRSGVTRQRTSLTTRNANKPLNKDHSVILPSSRSCTNLFIPTSGVSSQQLPTSSIATQRESIVTQMSTLSLQKPDHNNIGNYLTMPTQTTFMSSATMPNFPSEIFNKTNCNIDVPSASSLCFPSSNYIAGLSKNNDQFTYMNNSQHNRSSLNANAPLFQLPVSQANIFSCNSHAASNIFTAPFNYNNTAPSATSFSHLHNPSVFQQYSSGQAPAFSYNNFVPATNASHTMNSLSSNMTLSASQIAARQAISKDLPIFSGKPEEWPIFIANYLQSTERCGFTEQENLIRLQKCLKGQALEAVRGKLMIPSTVSFAIETLRMLYGRPETIHHALQRKLKDQPPVRKEKLDTLIHLALAVQNYRATMQAMGLADYLNDPMLLDDLVQKLPCDLKLDWGRYRCNIARVDITIFDTWLYNLANCASYVTPFAPASQCEFRKSGKERLNLHEVIDGNDIKKDSIMSISCFKCSKNHRLADCLEFLSLTINDRWKFVRKSGLCLRCFKKHSLRRCHSKKQCDVDSCKMPHNTLLHNSNYVTEGNLKKNTQQQNEKSSSAILFHAKENKSLFRYVPVTIFGKTHSLNTFALIDEGSSCTLIENELALELGLDGPTKELCLQWTGDITQTDENSKIVSFQISSRDQTANKMPLRNVKTISNLDLPEQTLTKEDISMYDHLRNLDILPYVSVKAKLLIGIDNARLCVPLEIKESANDGLIAIRCRIGWGVYGRQYKKTSSIDRILHVCSCGANDRMDLMLQNYFSLDSVGIKLNIKPLRSKQDEYATMIMEATTKYIAEEKVWETGLLWKHKNISLPDSFNMARRRLLCLESKMNKDSQLKSFLVDKIQDYEQKGYIRKLKPSEISNGGKSWYIPIFTVTNKNKNKTRIVWDAAATVSNVSLNSALLKGPDLLKSLVGVLIRFRERPVALSGDIREMFHQIRIIKDDQQAQQFLWRSGDSSKNIDAYVMTVMTFGATCSPSLANYIKNKNAERFSIEFPKAVDAILNNTFVDDWLQSVNTEDEMISLSKTVYKIHTEGGFEMRNWLSNSKRVLKALKCSLTKDKKRFESAEDNFEKVLGMWWMPDTDQLTFMGKFDPEVFDENVTPTKRSVLRVVMTIFDPLGLLGHFVIYAKIILQEIWRSRVNWDDPLFDEQRLKWRTWLQLLPDISKIRIPRCHQYLSYSHKIQLHTFVDASINAYAAAAYIRIEFEGNINCSLVSSKTRVAPLKPISIPKLELMAAVLGLRLANYITNEMSVKVHNKIFWSDSKDVLYWIRSDARKFQQFVSLRIGEILEGSQVKQWRWVQSSQNVADDGTKWNGIPNLNSDARWFVGPQFLKYNETQWPVSEFIDPPDLITERLGHIDSKKSKFYLSTIVPNPNNFSKWEILRLSQRFVFKYIRLVMSSHHIKKELQPFICDKNIESVELFILKACQEEMFYEEILALKANKAISNKSIIYKFSPYLDELGVLRVKGRIDAILNVSINVKRPIIMPRKHQITNLIIEFYHRKYHHHHNEIVVNELRQKFCIIGLRAAVRAVAKSCQSCKNKRVKPIEPIMGDLPAERLSSFTRPFHFTGVDYFGPIDIVIGRRVEKRWGVLFTCMTVRAVHIEIAPSLSTDSFLMAFKQFTSRRGVPRRILSDNATNFRGACRVLKEEIEKISTHELERKFPEIEWTFIPPSSPHMGGSWERMVRSIKSVLLDILPKSGVREEVLRAALADIEGIVNCRPLTYVPLDSVESEALTPNHFLIGSSSGIRERAIPDGSGLALSKNFRISSMIADNFWKRWLREVLPCLARRTKWYADNITSIGVNDVVVIVDEHTKRNTWAKGIVVDVHPGKDNVVRSAVVKTESGLLTRPIVKLAKLDIKK